VSYILVAGGAAITPEYCKVPVNERHKGWIVPEGFEIGDFGKKLATELSDELGNDKRNLQRMKRSSSLMDGDQMALTPVIMLS
jgi:hypothetical protein